MHKSLQFKMILLFSVLITFACVTISFFIYRSSTDLVSSTVGKQAESIVQHTVKVIDIKQYEELNSSSNVNTYYQKLRNKLNNIRKENGLEYLYTMSRKKTDHGYDYFYVVDGLPLDDKNASAFHEKEKEIDSFPLIKKTFQTGKKQVEMTYTEDYGGLLSAYIPIKSASGEIIGILGADINVSKVYKEMKDNQWKVLWTTVIILLLSILVVYLFSVYLVKPLRLLTEKIKLAGEGDLSIEFQVDRSDEIGVLSREFLKMTERIKTVIFGINRHSDQLIQTSAEISSRTSDTIEASKQITGSIQEISAGAEMQNQNSEKIAGSMEDVSKGVDHIAESSFSVNEMSTLTLAEAENGRQQIQDVVNQMQAINQSALESENAISALENRSKEISQIINVIHDISSQTNLLALNAAIEAARAGEKGKGFAVVAAEVKKLAEQTENSTAQIKGLIDNIYKDTNRTVEAMSGVTRDAKSGIKVAEEAGQTFDKIYTSIQDVVNQIHKVSSTSEEMSVFTEQIYASVSETAVIAAQAAANTRSAASVMEEQDLHVNHIGKSLKELTEMANEMQRLIQHFKL